MTRPALTRALVALMLLSCVCTGLSKLFISVRPQYFSWFGSAQGFLSASELGLAVAFVGLGFWAERSITLAAERGRIAVLVLLGRWLVAGTALIGGSLLLGLLAGEVVSGEPWPDKLSRADVGLFLSHQVNFALLADLFAIPAEVSSMYPLSGAVQLVLLLGMTRVLYPRLPSRLIAILAGLSTVVLEVLRQQLLVERGWVELLLHPLGRADAFSVGVLAATLASWVVARREAWSAAVLAICFLPVLAVVAEIEVQLAYLVPGAVLLAGLALWAGEAESASAAQPGEMGYWLRTAPALVLLSTPVAYFVAEQTTELNDLFRVLITVITWIVVSRVLTLVSWLVATLLLPTRLDAESDATKQTPQKSQSLA